MKEMKVAKGCIFLPGCEVRLEESTHRLWLRTPGAKVYYLHAESEQSGEAAEATNWKYLQSWGKALNYAMDAARGFKDLKVPEGNWLQKRGGSSHGHVNWKKRRFMLRGNLLLYYSEDPELFDAFKYLKGYVDLAAITAIDARENASDEIGKNFYFKLVVDNEREYYLAAQSLAQKDAWMKAIRKQTKLLSERLNYSNLRSISKTEKLQISGELQRASRTGTDLLRSYVVLTNLKFRYYDSQADFNIDSFGSRMVGSIALLGCATQLKDDDNGNDRENDVRAKKEEKRAGAPLSAPTASTSASSTSSTIILRDLQGHTFEFVARSPKDAAQWVIAIRTASRAIITSVLAKDVTISLNTYAIGKDGEPLGYTIVKLDTKTVRFFWLLLDKEKTLEWDEIDRVGLRDTDKFSLRYTRRRTSGKTKTIEFRSPNAIAFFDTISLVISLREEIEEKERKIAAKAALRGSKSKKSNAHSSPSQPKKGASDNVSSASPVVSRAVDPAKVMRRTNSALAMPFGPKMVQQSAVRGSNDSDSTSNAPHDPSSPVTTAPGTPTQSKIRVKSKTDLSAATGSSSPMKKSPSGHKVNGTKGKRKPSEDSAERPNKGEREKSPTARSRQKASASPSASPSSSIVTPVRSDSSSKLSASPTSHHDEDEELTVRRSAKIPSRTPDNDTSSSEESSSNSAQRAHRNNAKLTPSGKPIIAKKSTPPSSPSPRSKHPKKPFAVKDDSHKKRFSDSSDSRSSDSDSESS